jgi:Acetyltransferase (GNAT) family
MSVFEGANAAAASLDDSAALDFVETRVKGVTIKVPSVRVGPANIMVRGGFLKMAVVQDEELVEGDPITDPDAVVRRIRKAGLKADVFTFAQPLSDASPRFRYYFEWDNLAVAQVASYKSWWAELSDAVQRAVKKAKKLGVVLKRVEFDDEFVKGICGINNETPVRQGRSFWHYNKDFDTVKEENATYPDRNIFIGAYYENELIGFVRMVKVGKKAEIINILSQMRHYDKRPANALMAKAVEVCEEEGLSQLVYCNYVYRDPNSSLTEFKRRNRFEQVLVPRYYIPLTLKGRLALALKLHHGPKALIPLALLRKLAAVRSWFLEGVMSRQKPAAQA